MVQVDARRQMKSWNSSIFYDKPLTKETARTVIHLFAFASLVSLSFLWSVLWSKYLNTIIVNISSYVIIINIQVLDEYSALERSKNEMEQRHEHVLAQVEEDKHSTRAEITGGCGGLFHKRSCRLTIVYLQWSKEAYFVIFGVGRIPMRYLCILIIYYLCIIFLWRMW
jgi:hypothetical protein